MNTPARWLPFLLIAGIPSAVPAGTAPPRDGAAYLAERHILVSAEESALVDLGELSAPAAVPLAERLRAEGLPVERWLRRGVALVDVSREADAARIAARRPAELARAPVLFSKGSRLRVVPLPRVVFRLRPGEDPARLAGLLSSLEARNFREVRPGEYAADTAAGTNLWAGIRCAARLAAEPGVAWAAPDCAREAFKTYLPNDIAGLWHWHNTNAPPHTNDLDMAAAWDTTPGDPDVVIAVLDDGVDLSHPDLVDNLWVNPGEIAGDGADNDGNGYADDVNGWDFYKGTNDVRPDQADESHGTATAGLAAARGDNGLGVSGGCPRGRLLPIKIFDGADFVTDLQWADAIHYARRYARVISFSASTDAALADQLVSAFDAASTSCVVVASSGMSADGALYQTDCAKNYTVYGWLIYTQQVAGAGPHAYRWTYLKDSTLSLPNDCLWLDGVRLPDGQHHDFDDGVLPAGWTTGGHSPFFFSPSTGDCMAAGAYSLRSGPIGDNQTSWVEVVASGAGALQFYYQVHGEMGCLADNTGPYAFDYLSFSVDGTQKWADVQMHPDYGGFSFTNVAFPAALTSVVAVGASTVDGYRAPYSPFGIHLEVVAPSGGSAGERALRTTDRQGADGYSAGDYADAFSGTSASAPAVAGVAGLLFSAHPRLTAPEVRRLLREQAIPIGGAAYASGFHPLYGYGQVSAARSMQAMLSTMPPEIVKVERSGDQLRLTTAGIETGRVYHLYGASGLNPGGGWDWQWIPPSATGAPVFGVNLTPWWDGAAAAPGKVYRIEK